MTIYIILSIITYLIIGSIIAYIDKQYNLTDCPDATLWLWPFISMLEILCLIHNIFINIPKYVVKLLKYLNNKRN